MNASKGRSLANPVNAEPKRNDSFVSAAATTAAPGETSGRHFKFVTVSNSNTVSVVDVLFNDSIDFITCLDYAEVGEKVEFKVDNYEQLAKDLDGASPLEIMDRALEMFGDDIAIAFR